jgi:cytochrome c peroxidase
MLKLEEGLTTKISKRNSIIFFILGTTLLGGWVLYSFLSVPLQTDDLDSETLLMRLAEFSPPEPNVHTETQRLLAKLGSRLFFDERLSASGTMSCATCHDPQKNFSDDRPLALGGNLGPRRTPSLVNVGFQRWFFWDGRSPTLEAQVLGPLENWNEHRISRVHLLKILFREYRHDYETIFGLIDAKDWEWVQTLPSALPQTASRTLSPMVLAYGLASLDDFWEKDKILQYAQTNKIAPINVLSGRSTLPDERPQQWYKAWNDFDAPQKTKLNQWISNTASAIATFERTILAMDSPFDRFLKKNKFQTKQPIFVDGFQESEWAGFKLFVGKAQCSLCHFGFNFTDQQFHNIGLPWKASAFDSNWIDLGRTLGVAELTLGSQNLCTEIDMASESCHEIPYLDPNNLSFVGAFKTPSLRNASQRKFFMHDGRFSSLKDVLQYYNSLSGKASIGHREESLKPLRLTFENLNYLERFLFSLSSPISYEEPR